MKVEFLLDIVCPWCYIGKKYYDAIDIKYKKKITTFSWAPYFLNPEMEIKGINRQKYLNNKFRGKDNANRVYQNILLEGEKAGIKFDFDNINIMPNSLNAMKLISSVQDSEKASFLIDDLFKAFFIKGEDLGCSNVLLKYGKHYIDNLSITMINNFRNNKKILETAYQFKAHGISGVPAIIINSKHFIEGAKEPSKLENIFNSLS